MRLSRDVRGEFLRDAARPDDLLRRLEEVSNSFRVSPASGGGEIVAVLSTRIASASSSLSRQRR
jgi:hypothetical protein